MGVGYSKAFRCISFYGHLISGHFLLGYGIAGLFTVPVLRHVFKTELPFAVLIRRNLEGINIPRSILIRHKREDYILRTQSVGIIAVFPGLCAGDSNGFRCMCVGYCKAVCQISGDLRLVTFYPIFFDGINDLFASHRFRLIIKRESPGVRRSTVLAAACGNGDAHHFLAVCQQGNRYRLRTNAVLVVCILPDLGATDGDPFGFRIDHFVGDNKAFRCVSGNCRRLIIVYRLLINRVPDFLAGIIISVPVLKCCGPFILRIWRDHA